MKWLVMLLGGAWILWATDMRAPRLEHVPLHGFQSFVVCQRWVDALDRELVQHMGEHGSYIRCLPEEFDPRGPRAMPLRSK